MENSKNVCNLWLPVQKRAVHIDTFRKIIENRYQIELGDDYWKLHSWSTSFFPQFWEELWKFAKIISSKNYTDIIENYTSMGEIPRWFLGCELNYAENLLHFKDEEVAVFMAGEASAIPVSTTYKELNNQVSIHASILKNAGVEAGDRVVGYLPNQLEAVVAMLATASIGAIWSSTSPDFGVTAVLDRFAQIRPKVLFSIDKVTYNGRTFDNIEKLQKISDGLPSLELILIVPYDSNEPTYDLSKIKKSCYISDAVANVLHHNEESLLEFKQVSFSHPLFILYSSGTTGAPKCMVHSAGGTLIKHLSEHLLHGNMKRNDVMLYYTTIGWMMWNWLVSSLAIGSAIVLYDGSPFHPHAAALWDLVDKVGITILGTGAKWIAMCEEKGLRPRETHKLKTLHTLLSTGSPLSPSSFDYVYRDVKQDILLGSITGGSDIIACFAGQNATIPVNRGEIQGPLLGMAVECYDDYGNSVRGQKGELVCTKPFPSMPLFFWNDENNEKYNKAYFNKFPGVWSHGDFCVINPQTGGINMLGRSDGTLNPGGVRFGSSEIYNVVESMKEIADSICVSQTNEKGDERVVLFVKTSTGNQFCSELVTKIQQNIRKSLSARHIPGIILETTDIPYTVNGKKVEVAVKKILAGEMIPNKESIANPECLKYFETCVETLKF